MNVKKGIFNINVLQYRTLAYKCLVKLVVKRNGVKKGICFVFPLGRVKKTNGDSRDYSSLDYLWKWTLDLYHVRFAILIAKLCSLPSINICPTPRPK